MQDNKQFDSFHLSPPKNEAIEGGFVKNEEIEQIEVCAMVENELRPNAQGLVSKKRKVSGITDGQQSNKMTSSDKKAANIMSKQQKELSGFQAHTRPAFGGNNSVNLGRNKWPKM